MSIEEVHDVQNEEEAQNETNEAIEEEAKNATN